MERQKYLEWKFGNKEEEKKIYKNIYDVGISNNIYFQFDKITKTPNSFISHKLLALAFKKNIQTDVAETLFYEYFIEGVDIGSFEELIRIAKHHKIASKDNYEYLVSNQDNINLLAEADQARKLGVKGVPCFIINNNFVLFGAQDTENFIDIFNKTTK